MSSTTSGPTTTGALASVASPTTPSDGWASSEQLKRFASDLQLNMDSFEDCLDSGIHERKVKSNVFTAKTNGIFDIPTFVIVSSDGRHHIIKGIGNYEVFEMIIDSFTK